MPAKDVVIRLRGDISGFQSKMVAAGKSVSDLGNKITASERQSVKFRQGLTSVGDAAGKMGLLAAAGVGAAVVASAKFDAQMSSVQAATRATGNEMDRLRDLALKLGADSQFSATEAAQGIENLAKAGVSSADIMGGALKGSLDLAAAGQIEVADAAEYTATALTQFSLTGDQATHVADLLAAGAGKAQGEVSDMANALNYAGVPAANLGVSIEQTAGAIALFAKNGIVGEQAGTSLRGMLSALTSPSKVAAKEMDALGISVFDQQGKFLGLDGVAGQLHSRLSGLTDAERANSLGRIFGNEQLQAANVLYREGAAGVQTWTRNVNDSGFAAETAATKTDNLKGDIERLTGALDSLLISSGDGATGPLRNITQGLTGVVDTLNGLPDSSKNAALGLGAVTAATGAAVFLGSRVVTRIADTREALERLGASGSRAGAALRGLRVGGGVLIGLSAITLAAESIGDSFIDAYPGVERLTGELLKLEAEGKGKNLAQQYKEIGDSIRYIGDPNVAEKTQKVIAKIVTLGQATDSFEVKQAKEQIDSLDAAFANLVTSGSPDLARSALEKFADETNLTADQQKRLTDFMPQYKEALAGVANSTTLAGDAAADALNPLDNMGMALHDASMEAVTLHDALKSFFNLDADAATAALKEQIAGLAKDLKNLNGDDFSLDTKGGRENRAAIRDSVAALRDQADALDAQGVPLDKIEKKLRAGRQAISDQAKAKGLDEQATVKLLKQYNLTPKSITTLMNLVGTERVKDDIADVMTVAKKYQDLHPTTTIKVNGAGRAVAIIDGVRRELRNLDGTVSEPTIRLLRAVHNDDRLGNKGFADGGYTGNGGKYEPAGIVHRGEFVIDAANTRRHRALLEAIQGSTANTYRAQRAQIRGYATGGFVDGGGGFGIDYDRLASALSKVRPLYGDVKLQPHNYDQFKREMRADMAAASGGGVEF